MEGEMGGREGKERRDQGVQDRLQRVPLGEPLRAVSKKLSVKAVRVQILLRQQVSLKATTLRDQFELELTEAKKRKILRHVHKLSHSIRLVEES